MEIREMARPAVREKQFAVSCKHYATNREKTLPLFPFLCGTLGNTVDAPDTLTVSTFGGDK